MLFFFLALLSAWNSPEKVIKGVNFDGIPLGGKGYSEVMGAVAEEERRSGEQKIVLHIPGEKTLETCYAAVGITADRERIWQEALAQGHIGPWWERWRSRWLVERQGYNLPFYLLLNRSTAESVFKDLTQNLRTVPQDAQLRILPGDKISIIAEEYGSAADLNVLLNQLEQEIMAKPGQNIDLTVVMAKVRPAQTAEDLRNLRIEGVIGRFATHFVAERINRTKNIRLATAALDDVLILPGQEFSFNGTVGPRNFEKGYGEADVIINNELVPGVGGGVCQVSTTLYNAVLKANLEIVERHPHSMVIPYASAGLDATVVYGGKDLRFRNNTPGALLLKTAVSSGTLSVKIFGLPTPAETVKIVAFVEKEIPYKTKFREDPALPEGQYSVEREGIPGIVVRAERHTYGQGGQLIRREVISKDLYPPQDRIIGTLSAAPLLLEPDNL